MAIGDLSFAFDPSKETPDSVRKKREIVAAILATNRAPQNIGEGLNALGEGIAANVLRGRADKAQEFGTNQANEAFSRLFGGGTSSVPQAAPVGGSGDIGTYRDAIASIESAGSGDYAAVGPTHDKLGRALGRYQIMEANIAPWSQEALGRTISPDEFMADPALQDAIFDHKFGGYVDQYGPAGAAQAWFAGPGGVGKLDRQDSLGTDVATYTDKFNSALGYAPSQAETPVQAITNLLAGQPQRTRVAQGPSLDQLYQVAANPWLNDSQRGVVNALMQQQMQANDPLRQLQLQQGQLGLEKSRLELEQLRNPQQQMTAEQQNLAWRAQQAGLQPGTPEYQEFILGGGKGPMVSVNVGEGDKFFEELDKKNAQMFSDLSNAGAGAQRKLMQIDSLTELLANAPTGAGAGFKQFLGNFGIDSEGLSEIQAAQALINELVPQQRPAGSGPMSDADLELFKQSLPRIINQPGGNDLILQTMRGIAEYELQQGQIADMVSNREITPAEGRKRLRELSNPLDGFGERTKGFAEPVSDLPDGVREVDIQHTMQVHGLTREEVLERLNAN